MEIKKVYREALPSVKLVGRRFTDMDRDETGTFASHWQQAYRDRWFEALKDCGSIPGVSEDHLGAMRALGGEDSFEYWIGAFLAPDAKVPTGFEAVGIPAGEIAVCWLCGNGKNGELYGQEASDLSMAAFARQGFRISQTGWFFERYNCPRFTVPDGDGNVILDICVYLA